MGRKIVEYRTDQEDQEEQEPQQEEQQDGAEFAMERPHTDGHAVRSVEMLIRHRYSILSRNAQMEILLHHL